ncbi:MAG: efflux RND transporter permease subunit, partial [Nitrospinae bacterium]|nr:efflux RND transporter permease subunit [Nitrospinota bacterium]
TQQEISGRISGRFTSVEKIADLPLQLRNGNIIRLQEVAEVIDTHEDERLRVRLNGAPGIKMSIQKQPTANTVAVVDVVNKRLEWLKQQNLIPDDIEVKSVSDQSVYIRNALNNSTLAALSGALLAMIVVYIFLGNLKRTLIIGSAIPIAVMVTFILMAMGGLTLNIMTLGGLALGVGMLVDNTIVMMENIYRHQRKGESGEDSGVHAAAEVNSAIVASTSTNLAAVLPFLFIGGLVGLLFRELIFTISAAIFSSMVIALTLVPSLAAKVKISLKESFRGGGRTFSELDSQGISPEDSSINNSSKSSLRTFVDTTMEKLQDFYQSIVEKLLKRPLIVIAVFIVTLAVTVPFFLSSNQIFLPNMDDGRVSVNITVDPGLTLDQMDESVKKIEDLFSKQPEVEHVFSLVGGRIFGRTQREVPNKTSIDVQLIPVSQRNFSSHDWVDKMNEEIANLQLPGVKVLMRIRGIRGIKTNKGEDDISLRIQGPSINKLEEIAEEVSLTLKNIKGLRNVMHSLEEQYQEIAIEIDRDRAAVLGYDVEDISTALQIALEGMVVTDFIDNDRSYDVRLRLPRVVASNPQDLESILLFPATKDRQAVYLGDIAAVQLIQSPAKILRDNQLRIVEVTASVMGESDLGTVLGEIDTALKKLKLPHGYSIYDGGAKETLQEGQQLTTILLLLALFLVFVVMAVQYESLRNPLVIMLSVPFAVIGVAIGLIFAGLPISMPVWLGTIMLAGIVVNNSIVLVEYIEIVRETGRETVYAIIEAARLRLRPIIMTTLTTVFGMIPLALGLGEGAEMLQPLAVTIVSGLSFSMLVSLVLVPVIYLKVHSKT